MHESFGFGLVMQEGCEAGLPSRCHRRLHRCRVDVRERFVG
jgi:hypothetical protein